MWGIFEDIPDEVHVVPISDNSKPKEPHILDCFCYCDPVIEEVNTVLIVTHNEEN